MLYLWMIAGWLIGWILIEIIGVLLKVQKIPGLYNLAMGFIGSLTAYTLIEGMCHAL